MITLEKNTIKYKTVNNQEQNFLINLNTERGSVVIENIIKQSHLTEQDRNNYELELKNDLYIQGAKVVNIKNSTWKMVKTESLNKKEIQTIIKNELH